MRILHVTAYCSAFSKGGTEQYVDSLADALKAFGVENHILAVTPNGSGSISPEITAIYPRSRKDDDLASFRRQCRTLLDDFKPDWIFIHTSDLMEVEIARVAVESKIPYIFFYHAPYWLCAHFDMLYCGKEVCHQMFCPWRCSVCMAAGKSKSVIKGTIVTLAGELQRVLRLAQNSWLNSFRYELPWKEYIVRNATKIIALNEHDKDVMLENGIANDKIAVIPQGLSDTLISQLKENATTVRTGCLKIGYVGRVAKIKGCQLLVEAMKQIPAELQLELHIYGCKDISPFCQQLYQTAGDDKRIVFHSLMPVEEVLKEYARLDVLCIPSIVFETGPLTLFEGIYSGCRVYGSTMIGQIELLRKYGTVVDDNTSEAWKNVFCECVINLSQLRSQRSMFFSYRTMATVAYELNGIIDSFSML